MTAAAQEPVRLFRVFISSTFEDMAPERDALAERVYPQLSRLCGSHGVGFQAVDLRWGISSEANLDQQTVALCLAEIRRCQRLTPRPNFVVLLGDRYGWRPLPAALAADEYGSLLAHIEDDDDRALLDRWYRRDDNGVPPACLLQPRIVPPADDPKAQAEAALHEAAAWAEVEPRIRSILLRAAAQLAAAGGRAPSIDTSITEQEILAGALDPALDRPGDNVFVFIRQLPDLPPDPSGSRYLDIDESGHVDASARQRLAALTARLREELPGHVFEYEARWDTDRARPTADHLQTLCADVHDCLAQVIRGEITERAEARPEDLEAAAHIRWGSERARTFVGREDLLDSIAAYVSGEDPRPLVVQGPGGSGKTALLTQAGQRAAHDVPTATVIVRHVGATPESTSGSGLLLDICRQIGHAFHLDQPLPTDFQRLVGVFRERLALASHRQPLIVLLDGVDQLRDSGPIRELGWIPQHLPPHSRLVWSTGVAPQRIDNTIRLPELSGAAATGLLDQLLGEVGRTLTPEQRSGVLERIATGAHPLYVRLLFDRVRRWHSYDSPPAPATDVAGLIDEFVTELGAESRHGTTLVERSLSYLAAARDGLTEAEILGLLSADPDVLADFRRRFPRSPAVSSLPPVVWSRLRDELQPYLSELGSRGSVLLGFSDTAVADRADRALDPQRHARHAALADFFAAQPAELRDEDATRANLRRLAELPYQLIHADRREPVCELLTDAAFVTAKLGAAGPDALAQDYREARRQGIVAGELDVIERFLALAGHILADDPAQLPAQASARLAASPTPGIERFVAALRPADRAWLRPVSSDLAGPDGPLQRILVGHRNEVRRVAFLDDGRRILSAGADGTHRIWDTATGEVVLVLADGPEAEQRWAEAGPAAHPGTDPSGRRTVQISGNEIEVRGPEAATPKLLLRHHHPVSCTAFSPDGSLLVSGGSDQAIRVWSLDRVTDQSMRPGVLGAVIVAETVVAACADDTLRLIGLTDGAERAVRGTEGVVTALCADPPGQRVITGTGTGIVGTWRLGPDVAWGELGRHGGRITAVAAASNAARAISAATDGSLQAWDLDRGVPLATLEGTTDLAPVIAVSADGSRAAVAYPEQIIGIWNLDTGDLAATCVGHTGPVTALRFVGTEALLSGSRDQTLRLWDPATGLERDLLTGHWRAVLALDTGDTDRAVSVGADATVRVWDLATRAELLTLGGVRIDPFGRPSEAPSEARTGFAVGGASGVVVTADGHTALSFYDNDDTLRIWDLASGTEQAAFTCDEVVSTCSLSDDGRSVLAVTDSGGVQILHLETSP